MIDIGKSALFGDGAYRHAAFCQQLLCPLDADVQNMLSWSNPHFGSEKSSEKDLADAYGFYTLKIFQIAFRIPTCSDGRCQSEYAEAMCGGD